jgi:hypothetical protein
MPGRSAKPDQIAKVVAMREAGYTTAMIKEKTGLSVATITRIYAKQGAQKGLIQKELVDEARQNLSESLRQDNSIAELTARLLADNLSHVNLGRIKMLEALEHLQPSETGSAALTLRACAAYFTALKASTDALRSLSADLEAESEEDFLPELVIRRMTDCEVVTLRKLQQEEYELMGVGNDDSAEREQILSEGEE